MCVFLVGLNDSGFLEVFVVWIWFYISVRNYIYIYSVYGSGFVDAFTSKSRHRML